MTIDKAKRRKAVARWHRRFAIFISIWLILLAVTGLLINHAHDWKLDSESLAKPLQRWVYGIDSNEPDLCEPLTREGIACDQLFARLQLPVGVLLLGVRDLFLLDDSGQLVEKLSVSQFGLASLQAALGEGSDIYLRGSEQNGTDYPGFDGWPHTGQRGSHCAQRTAMASRRHNPGYHHLGAFSTGPSCGALPRSRGQSVQ